jgi:hypothetical protein
MHVSDSLSSPSQTQCHFTTPDEYAYVPHVKLRVTITALGSMPHSDAQIGTRFVQGLLLSGQHGFHCAFMFASSERRDDFVADLEGLTLF